MAWAFIGGCIVAFVPLLTMIIRTFVHDRSLGAKTCAAIVWFLLWYWLLEFSVARYWWGAYNELIAGLIAGFIIGILVASLFFYVLHRYEQRKRV